MLHLPRRQSFLSACLLACTVASCGGDGARTFGGESTGGRATGARDGGFADTSATGGSASSGGATASSGGTSGSGGLPGSGGSGTGGTSSGGAGSGGSTASTGGVRGTGGGPGTGGHFGSGGTGGSNSGVCDQLAMDYQKEMPNAKACTIGFGLTQCQTAIANALGCSGCPTYVQDPSNLNELKRKWTGNNCDATIRLCPAGACVQPQPGNCSVSGSLGNPQCQDRPVQ